MGESAVPDSSLRKQMIRIVKELVSVDTTNPPGNEYKVAPIVEKYLRQLGMKTKQYSKGKGRVNVVGRVGSGSGLKGEGPRFAFLVHTDVVPADAKKWKADPFAAVVKGDKIYGRGTTDNKGMFAVCWGAAKMFLDSLKASGQELKGSVYILACADEETGSEFGAKWLLPKLRGNGIKLDGCIVPDAGAMDEAIYGEKGCLRLKITSFGKAAHGSTPYKGHSALVALSDLVLRLENMRVPGRSSPVFKGPTVNVGKMSGGIVVNMVPAEAVCEVDIRLPLGVGKNPVTKVGALEAVREEVAKVKKKYPWARFEVEEVLWMKPHLADRNSRVVRALRGAAEEMGIDMKLETIGGATLGKDLVLEGIPAVVHLPGLGDQAHVPDEHASIPLMMKGAELYARALARPELGISGI